MDSIVIGLGETGLPLYNILKEAYPDTHGADIKTGYPPAAKMECLNICIPYSEKFVDIVKEYQGMYEPKITIIHSTVPIGTTSKIGNVIHSPILGKHDNMENSLRRFAKWVGGKDSFRAAAYLQGAGFHCAVVDTSEETEALKLMCLAKYGMSIAFAQYQKNICDTYGFSYSHVLAWDRNYNSNVAENFKRPIILSPEGKIGGHCVIPNTKILNEQHPNFILWEILKYENDKEDTAVVGVQS